MTKKTPTTYNPASYAHLSNQELMSLIEEKCRRLGCTPRVELVDGKFRKLR